MRYYCILNPSFYTGWKKIIMFCHIASRSIWCWSKTQCENHVWLYRLTYTPTHRNPQPFTFHVLPNSNVSNHVWQNYWDMAKICFLFGMEWWSLEYSSHLRRPWPSWKLCMSCTVHRKRISPICFTLDWSRMNIQVQVDITFHQYTTDRARALLDTSCADKQGCSTTGSTLNS